MPASARRRGGRVGPQPDDRPGRKNQVGVLPAELALVAAHDWDIDGAGKAGLTTAYLARKQPRGSSAMRPPDVRGTSLPETARALIALPDPR